MARAATIAALGLGGRLRGDDLDAVRNASDDPEPAVRAAAVAALVRAGPVADARAAWRAATGDPDPTVRRRAADLAPALRTRSRGGDAGSTDALVGLLADRDLGVVEAAAWALGEGGPGAPAAAVAALSRVATDHPDALAREAAVAALGAVGDSAGLPAVLAACNDRPAVRRRAVLALAPFTGPAVDAALDVARTDRDWQVRQAAEDLLGIDGDGDGGADEGGDEGA